MPLILRLAQPKDSEFVFQVKRAAFREYAEQVWGWDDIEQWALHKSRFASQAVRIIEVDSRQVGFLSVDVAPDALHLKQLFLLPECQSQGIGRACMALLFDDARALGLPILLRVLKVNPRARAFYERLGFTCVGETDTHHLFKGTL